jgi:hypothetical protein
VKWNVDYLVKRCDAERQYGLLSKVWTTLRGTRRIRHTVGS